MTGEMRPRNPDRGAGLMIEHFAAFDRMSCHPREPARVRLQRALGPDLSQLLLRALARESASAEASAVIGDPAA